MSIALIIIGSVLQVVAILIPTIWQLRRRGRPSTWDEVENPPLPPIVLPLVLSVVGITMIAIDAIMS